MKKGVKQWDCSVLYKPYFNSKRSIEEAKENEKRYLAMTPNELSALSDDELFEAVIARTESEVDSFDEWENGVNSLNSSQKLFYSVN